MRKPVQELMECYQDNLYAAAFNVCRNPEEVELMKSCTYAYRYPTTLVLKSFREDKKR